ncbi:hypothetical protein CUJ83_13935 [Methanocella sp. CWC-04]|uniref:Dolichyl-phosphate-mannose-protein mannosyltransferase n=1 Tax=Methanooceanicella nereidis TaxID=2052831 RepID=A0AAP2W8D2_9EURY|nr:glycosyltransferase family 39 protein [Methanocella sp. CWC-04]MCD1296099.1 hypothetical protein [Methanocella sp. CWC-04]
MAGMDPLGLIRGNEKKISLLIILAAAIILFYLALTTQVRLVGDGSTYYMQMQSIVNDLDIQYQEKDIIRALDVQFDILPQNLFLIKTGSGDYFYGKDFSYALFASPFYMFLGNNGILLFNALMIFSMILFGYFHLRKNNGSILSIIVSLLFFALSVVLIYMFWIHADIYNMFLIMTGMFLWTVYHDKKDIRWLGAASLFLGLAVVAKAPNAALFIPIISYELYNRRLKNSAIIVLMALIPVLVFYGYFHMNAGTLSFYGGDRYNYMTEYPFVNGYDSQNEAGIPYFSISSDKKDIMLNLNDITIIPYNVFYYLFGKFSGILWYYPLAVFAMLAFLLSFKERKDEKVKDDGKPVVFSCIALYILMFTTVLGNNYMGGACNIGNRYFYIYPIFLLLIGKVDIKKIAIFIVLALITLSPILMHPNKGPDQFADHIDKFPYRYFPIEYSQLDKLWIPSYEFNGFDGSIYRLDNNAEYATDGFFITNTSEMLLVSGSEMNETRLRLFSYENDNMIKIIVGSKNVSTVLNKYGYDTIAITDIQPEYKDGKYWIYRLSISSDGKILMIPMTEENIVPGLPAMQAL